MAARQDDQDDRCDRDRNDREVDGEVAEVVHEPLADLEWVVAAPELPVRAERVRGRYARGEPRDEREDGERERQHRRPEADELRPPARARPRRDHPVRAERADPRDGEDTELRAREKCNRGRRENGETVTAPLLSLPGVKERIASGFSLGEMWFNVGEDDLRQDLLK